MSITHCALLAFIWLLYCSKQIFSKFSETYIKQIMKIILVGNAINNVCKSNNTFTWNGDLQ